MVLFQNKCLNNNMIIFNHHFKVCSMCQCFVVNDIRFLSNCVFCIFSKGARIKEIGSNGFNWILRDAVFLHIIEFHSVPFEKKS